MSSGLAAAQGVVGRFAGRVKEIVLKSGGVAETAFTQLAFEDRCVEGE
jgi:hypothetical protein